MPPTIKTKEVIVSDEKYVIKRFTFDDVQQISAATTSADRQAMEVVLGTVEPKFESVEEVRKYDNETVLGLYIELEEFNKVNVAFLDRLRSLSLQELQIQKTQKS